MSLAIAQSNYFFADLQRQLDYYRDHAGSDIAVAYVDAVEATLYQLAASPGIGQPPFRNWLELAGMRSWRVQRPFHRHLIFTDLMTRGFSRSVLFMVLAIFPVESCSLLTKQRITLVLQFLTSSCRNQPLFSGNDLLARAELVLG